MLSTHAISNKRKGYLPLLFWWKKTTFITSFINVEKTRHKHPLYVVYADSMNITQTKHPYSLLIRYIQTIYGALAPNLEQNID